VSNRIAKYFDDDRDQDLYEEICQAGWDGMLNQTLEIWFGAYPDIPGQDAQDPVEDFGFTTLQSRKELGYNERHERRRNRHHDSVV
jgi:hypothetical protein